jgi:hypothetical protein
VSGVAASIAEASDVPLDVVGCDLGPWRMALSRRTPALARGPAPWSGWASGSWLTFGHALFIDHEGCERSGWRPHGRSGSIIAVSGIINRHNMEYHHSAGELADPRPDLCLRVVRAQILLEVSGYRPDGS